MASSRESKLSHVRVGENRNYIDDYRGSGIGGGTGRIVHHRRPSHDFSKLPKMGNGPSVSSEEIHAPFTDSKGIALLYIPNYLIHVSPNLP